MRLDISVTHEEWKILLTDAKATREALPIGEAGIPEGAPIISDEFQHRYHSHISPIFGFTADAVFHRHIIFGAADGPSVNDFKAWADDAGRCIAMRPTSKDKNGSGFPRWLEYVCSTAVQKIPGCRLHADYPTLMLTQHLLAPRRPAEGAFPGISGRHRCLG